MSFGDWSCCNFNTPTRRWIHSFVVQARALPVGESMDFVEKTLSPLHHQSALSI